MAYTYTKNHLSCTEYNLKYKFGNAMTPTEITYHQTSNNAPAINERNYLNNRTDKVYISFHMAVDENQAIECLPLNVGAWACGDGSTGAGNTKSINVEIARSTHEDLNIRNAAIDNGARLIAKLMKDYNIPLNKVKSHYDRSKKNCPHDIRGRYGETKFRNLIQKYYDELNGSASTSPDVPTTSTDIYRVRKSWSDASSQKGAYSNLENAKKECDKHEGYSVFDSKGVVIYPTTVATAPAPTELYKVKIISNELNVRQSASFDSKVVMTVKKGEVFTITEESNGLLKLKSGKGWISANPNYVQKI